MNTKRRPWLNGVILLTSLAGLVSIAAEKNNQAPTNFYAYYTKLDYQQPDDPRAARPDSGQRRQGLCR